MRLWRCVLLLVELVQRTVQDAVDVELIRSHREWAAARWSAGLPISAYGERQRERRCRCSSRLRPRRRGAGVGKVNACCCVEKHAQRARRDVYVTRDCVVNEQSGSGVNGFRRLPYLDVGSDERTTHGGWRVEGWKRPLQSIAVPTFQPQRTWRGSTPSLPPSRVLPLLAMSHLSLSLVSTSTHTIVRLLGIILSPCHHCICASFSINETIGMSDDERPAALRNEDIPVSHSQTFLSSRLQSLTRRRERLPYEAYLEKHSAELSTLGKGAQDAMEDIQRKWREELDRERMDKLSKRRARTAPPEYAARDGDGRESRAGDGSEKGAGKHQRSHHRRRRHRHSSSSSSRSSSSTSSSSSSSSPSGSHRHRERRRSRKKERGEKERGHRHHHRRHRRHRHHSPDSHTERPARSSRDRHRHSRDRSSHSSSSSRDRSPTTRTREHTTRDEGRRRHRHGNGEGRTEADGDNSSKRTELTTNNGDDSKQGPSSDSPQSKRP